MLKRLALCWLAIGTASAANVALMGAPTSFTADIARAGGYPNQLRVQKMDQLNRCLMTSGVYSQLDMFNIYANSTASLAGRDWISPTRVSSEVNSPNFTADLGYASNGTTSGFDSGYSPGANMIHLSSFNALFGTWSLTATQNNAPANGTNQYSVATSGVTTGSALVRISNNTQQVTVSTSTALGPGFGIRSNSAAFTFYTSNTITPFTIAANVLSVTPTMTVGYRNATTGPANFNTYRWAAMWAGGAISPNQAAPLQVCLQNYLGPVTGVAIQ